MRSLVASVALLAFALLGCDAQRTAPPPRSSGVAAQPPATGAAPSERATQATGPGASLLDVLCHAQYVDGSSRVFIGRDKAGAIVRYQVTPSRNIADLGNLFFDRDGTYLGTGMGGELPWGDEAAMKGLRERDAELQAGADFTEGPSCTR